MVRASAVLEQHILRGGDSGLTAISAPELARRGDGFPRFWRLQVEVRTGEVPRARDQTFDELTWIDNPHTFPLEDVGDLAQQGVVAGKATGQGTNRVEIRHGFHQQRIPGHSSSHDGSLDTGVEKETSRATELAYWEPDSTVGLCRRSGQRHVVEGDHCDLVPAYTAFP